MLSLIACIIFTLTALITGVIAVVNIFKKNWKKFFLMLAAAIVATFIAIVCFFLIIADGIGAGVAK
ncbi:MAG: hypothetical protein ACOVQE_00480 [Chitinophagaceae bacterium]